MDVRDVTYIDSAGVGMLVAKLKTVRSEGGDVKLLNLTARSHRLLAMTPLTFAFETVNNLAQAERSFAASQKHNALIRPRSAPLRFHPASV